MADLSGYNAEDHEPLGDFSPVPKGDYQGIAIESEMKSTKAGTGNYLSIVWELIDDEYQGRKLFSNINLDNPNPKAVEIAQRELSSICRATGVLRPKDSEELHNIPVMLKVGVEKRKDTEEFSNRIKGYSAIEGSNSQPSGKSKSSSGSSTPPWKK